MTNTTLRYHIPVTGQQRVYQEHHNRHWSRLRRAVPSGRAGSGRACFGRPAVRCYAAPVSASSAPEAAGITGLYGLLAYAELVAFYRLSDDGKLAPTLADKAAMAGMAVAEFSHFERIRAELERLGADPGQAMAPFIAPLDAFHARTVPSDWLEGLVKAYVGDGISADFYRMIADLTDTRTQTLVNEVLADTGHADFVIVRVREAITANPSVAGRLALWARRLVGEAVGQAQRVASEREALAHLLAGGDPAQRGKISRMFARLTDANSRRMAALGLTGHSTRSRSADRS